jgi:hypothetical protein
MFDNAPGLRVELHFPSAAEYVERERGQGIANEGVAP